MRHDSAGERRAQDRNQVFNREITRNLLPLQPIISGSLDNFRERYAPLEPPLIAPPKFPSKRTKSMSGNAIRRTLEEELGEGGGEGN